MPREGPGAAGGVATVVFHTFMLSAWRSIVKYDPYRNTSLCLKAQKYPSSSHLTLLTPIGILWVEGRMSAVVFEVLTKAGLVGLVIGLVGMWMKAGCPFWTITRR